MEPNKYFDNQALIFSSLNNLQTMAIEIQRLTDSFQRLKYYELYVAKFQEAQSLTLEMMKSQRLIDDKLRGIHQTGKDLLANIESHTFEIERSLKAFQANFNQEVGRINQLVVSCLSQERSASGLADSPAPQQQIVTPMKTLQHQVSSVSNPLHPPVNPPQTPPFTTDGLRRRREDQRNSQLSQDGLKNDPNASHAGPAAQKPAPFTSLFQSSIASAAAPCVSSPPQLPPLSRALRSLLMGDNLTPSMMAAQAAANQNEDSSMQAAPAAANQNKGKRVGWADEDSRKKNKIDSRKKDEIDDVQLQFDEQRQLYHQRKSSRLWKRGNYNNFAELLRDILENYDGKASAKYKEVYRSCPCAIEFVLFLKFEKNFDMIKLENFFKNFDDHKFFHEFRLHMETKYSLTRKNALIAVDDVKSFCTCAEVTIDA